MSLLGSQFKKLFQTRKIDILVNNAGYGMFGPIEDITIDDIKEQFETNFLEQSDL
jgi:short-subunit dehydrogenase